MKALLEKDSGQGFEGWASSELVNPDPTTPKGHARSGAIAWEKMLHDDHFDARCCPRPKKAQPRIQTYGEERHEGELEFD